MVIEIKSKDTVLIFSEWKTSDPKFMWYREITNLGEEAIDLGAGITLLCFYNVWSVRFFAGNLFRVVIEAYNLMYPKDKTYLTAEEAKDDMDKFLHRVNSLKIFL